MLLNSVAPTPFIYYALEPGDGTVYRFGLMRLESAIVKKGMLVHLYPGCGNGKDYVGVLINMPAWQGYYELRKDSLKGIAPHYVNYVANHMTKDAYPPTVCAVLLALEVLLDEPINLTLACENMLRWREVLEEA